MIVLDASVLIAHVESADAHHDRATALLLELAEEDLGASPITLAELLVGPARIGRLGAARAVLDDLGITAIPLGDDAPARLAELRAGTGLRLPDCCVLLAAQSVDGAIATFDVRLSAAAAGLGLRIAG